VCVIPPRGRTYRERRFRCNKQRRQVKQTKEGRHQSTRHVIHIEGGDFSFSFCHSPTDDINDFLCFFAQEGGLVLKPANPWQQGKRDSGAEAHVEGQVAYVVASRGAFTSFSFV
jgi:hypothetical protein